MASDGTSVTNSNDYGLTVEITHVVCTRCGEDPRDVINDCKYCEALRIIAKDVVKRD